MLHVAIIGSGPAGFYTAEALVKSYGARVEVDVIDRLPTPYGLIRNGVAPDHQAIKAVDKRFAATATGGSVRFVGCVDVGSAVTMDELTGLYDAVVLATGAPRDRKLGLPGEDLPGVIGSAAFVGWYNGHPDFAALDVPLGHPGACIIGNGNVALDVARLLAKTRDELAVSDVSRHARTALGVSRITDIHLIGRRGPLQAGFTPKEMGEMGRLAGAQPFIDPALVPAADGDARLDTGLRKTIQHLREFAATTPAGKPITVSFDFLTRPVAVEAAGDHLRLTVEKTRLDGDEAIGTGEFHHIDCGLVVPCIGYRTIPLEGVAYDERAGRFVNDNGLISPGLYAVGWARRGPSGTIGTNRPDGFAIAARIEAEVAMSDKRGGTGLDELLAARGVTATGFAEWQRIDAAEIAAALPGAPREKFVSRDELAGAARA